MQKRGYLFVDEHAGRLGVDAKSLMKYLCSLNWRAEHRIVVVSDGVSLLSMQMAIPERSGNLATVSLVKHQRSDPHAKSIAWGTDPLKQNAQEWEEQLMMDLSGRVLEGASSNVFLVYTGPKSTTVVQTAPEALVLPGTMRKAVLEALSQMPHVTLLMRPFEASDISPSTGMFLSSTSRYVLPIDKVVSDAGSIELASTNSFCLGLMSRLQSILSTKYLSVLESS